jgi:hypothetical protein
MIKIHQTFQIELQFYNSINKIIRFDPALVFPQKYSYFDSFFVLDDGIIIVLKPHETRIREVENEILRRNIIKIDENGKVIWTIEDPKNHIKLLNRRATFENIELLDNGTVLAKLNNGKKLFINCKTGKLFYTGIFKKDNLPTDFLENSTNTCPEIHNINQGGTFLKFRNKNNELITVNYKDLGYEYSRNFVQVNNTIIICFDYWKFGNQSEEKKRRNVICIDDTGKVLWVIADHYDIYSCENVGFDKEGGCIVLIGAGFYSINPETGEIKYLYQTH